MQWTGASQKGGWPRWPYDCRGRSCADGPMFENREQARLKQEVVRWLTVGADRLTAESKLRRTPTRLEESLSRKLVHLRPALA
ncbi:hypothetical protein PGT21_003248 [Puccinia graminis f. sp. tritici]|uniref:Uncharacterized protein n=1 Tax=Puccinia graminis f. sp. tritici TaxID=56615 RepID=A0A5B0SB47_PUCGR|nr:hypothetical protein PGT21_003248 [Puccinia graminis f. sp. tritici]KAA1133674.1 hypothetical protein PGTUg99_030650 [Puccinia graminis f. sp. tritici]